MFFHFGEGGLESGVQWNVSSSGPLVAGSFDCTPVSNFVTKSVFFFTVYFIMWLWIFC